MHNNFRDFWKLLCYITYHADGHSFVQASKNQTKAQRGSGKPLILWPFQDSESNSPSHISYISGPFFHGFADKFI